MPNYSGFTLVEVLLAVVLAAIIFPAVILLLSLGSFTSGQGESYTQAYAITQQEMENIYSLKAQNWSLNMTDGSKTPVNTDSDFTKSVTISPVTRCSGNIICTGGTPDANTKLVTVAVSWNERNSNPSIQIESYVAKN